MISVVTDREAVRWSGPLRSHEEVFEFARSLCNLAREEFWCIYLDKKLKPIGIFRTQGAVSATIVPVLECCTAAVLLDAVYAVAVHNHPSGDSAPSVDDSRAMARLDRAFEGIGVGFSASYVVADDIAHIRFNGGRAIPFVELKVSRSGQPLVSGPSDVPKRAGVLLLDRRHRIITSIPFITDPVERARVIVKNLPARAIFVDYPEHWREHEQTLKLYEISVIDKVVLG
jgi:DNA repair protein RadC